MSEEVQEESISKNEMRELAREDIENLILNKIVESINMHSSIGALHTKLLTVELQRDKLLHRVTNLQRQVVDLTKAVRSMSENVGRQNGNDTQAYQPIRFYRSVGLQVDGFKNFVPNNSNSSTTTTTTNNSVVATRILQPNQAVRPATTTAFRAVTPDAINKFVLNNSNSTPNNSVVAARIIQQNQQQPIRPAIPTTTTGFRAVAPNTVNKFVLNNSSTTNNSVISTRVIQSNQAIRPPALLRAAVPDGIKKFVLPPLPPPSITGMPRRCAKDIPPRPELTLQEQNDGIVLSWTLKLGSNHADIQTYQIYACQEPQAQTAQTKAASWKRVGDVKALPLPMACTLSQFAEENRYHFIVRGVDVYNRTGPFCEVTAIRLDKKKLL